MQELQSWLTKLFGFTVPMLLLNVVMFVVVFFVLVACRKIVRGIFLRKITRNHSLLEKQVITYKRLINTVIDALFWLLVVVLALSLSGLTAVVTTVISFASIMTLIIGLATQDFIKDFVAGFDLLINGKILLGEWIESAGAVGEVEDITFRNTLIRGVDNQLFFVPNKELSKVINYSRGNIKVKLDIVVASTEYIASIREAVKVTIDKLALENSAIVKDNYSVFVSDFNAKTVTVRINFFTKGKVANIEDIANEALRNSMVDANIALS